jgi:hypothetical protein
MGYSLAACTTKSHLAIKEEHGISYRTVDPLVGNHAWGGIRLSDEG